jgi:PadR family transcriptional regulator PadR
MDTDPHVRKFQKELATGTVALLLLSVLGRSDRPLYGYEIAKQLEREGESPVAGKQSALYPVLRNLHSAGLLDSHVEPSVTGPPRRYYQATNLGRAVLADWQQAWFSTRDFVDDTLAG